MENIAYAECVLINMNMDEDEYWHVHNSVMEFISENDDLSSDDIESFINLAQYAYENDMRIHDCI